MPSRAAEAAVVAAAITTEIGQLVELTSNFNLNTNSLSSKIPTQLGKLGKMSDTFTLNSNSFSAAACGLF